MYDETRTTYVTASCAVTGFWMILTPFFPILAWCLLGSAMGNVCVLGHYLYNWVKHA